ncbi:Zn-binding domain-containing protein [Cystobacter fuscus]
MKGRKKARKGDEEDPFGHAKGCVRFGKEPEPLAVTTKTPATTLRLRVRLPVDMGDEDYQRWGQSLGYALRTGMRHLYMLDGPEIEFVLEPMWKSMEGGSQHQEGALTFIDPAVGGSGFLERATRELHLVARRALEHLEHPDCETACYRCLKSYQNQRVHASLNWPLVVPELEALAETPPSPNPTLPDDPLPWLQAYEAGVGSPLEHRFLKLFEEHGLSVDKQVPLSADKGGKRISTADFVISGSRLVVYIDGAAFHRGQRLRRDRYIRERLQKGNKGWRIEVLGAADLSRGRALVEHLRALSVELGPPRD